jgi:hypothetical protein
MVPCLSGVHHSHFCHFYSGPVAAGRIFFVIVIHLIAIFIHFIAIFMQGLWLLDDYWRYSCFNLLMILVFEGTVVLQRLKSIQTLKVRTLSQRS